MLHTDLDVYKKSIDFVTDIYKLTKTFPDEEKFSLTSQLRRAATSIPSNIAEGSARNSKKELKQFLYIALGSLAESETQLIIASKIGYISDKDSIFKKIEEVRRPLLGLISYAGNKQK